MTENKTIVLIDKLIFGFVIIFLLSLTNSIFVNQLGYYGALLLILTRYFLTRENQFRKTGLEIFFALFLLAEILSAIFSNEHGHAFTNFTKRLLLIPTFYTITVAASDIKKAKLFFKVFIGASLISIIIYLVNSYYYYILNLYQIQESGPSLFQYPITASEIMSFTVIFLFAFLLNEKQCFRYKLLITVLFILSSLALLSTYKRTGWIGTAAGIFTIIILKKNWKLIIPIAAVFIALMFLEKNTSDIYLYNIGNGSLKQQAKISTEGRAYQVFSEGGFTYATDYEKGILKLKGKEVQNKIKLPESVVVHLGKWNNEFLAYLIDTRFIVMDKDTSGNLHKVGEAISPGFTVSYQVANGFLYVMDKDSGLTIFKDPENLKEKIRIAQIRSEEQIYIDSTKLFFYDPELNGLVQYSLHNGLPAEKPAMVKLSFTPEYMYYNDGRLIASSKDGLKLFRFDSLKPELLDKTTEIKNVFSISKSSDKLLITDLNKNIYFLNYASLDKSLDISFSGKLGFVPKSVEISGDSTLYASNVIRGRISSIFDPYLPSNFNRLALWRAGILMLKDHPLFGVGDIDLNGLYRQYKRYYDKELQGHLHNNYIHFLAILGIIGFIAVMLLLGKIMQFNLKIYKSLKDEPFASSYALGTIGGFIAFLFAGLTEWNFGDHEVITMVWFTMGLNAAFYFIYEKGNRKRPKPNSEQIIQSEHL